MSVEIDHYMSVVQGLRKIELAGATGKFSGSPAGQFAPLRKPSLHL